VNVGSIAMKQFIEKAALITLHGHIHDHHPSQVHGKQNRKHFASPPIDA
jgi:Icc-related predicted phosphoesterase